MRTASDGTGSVKPRESFIAVMPATSKRMAVERKSQGIGSWIMARRESERTRPFNSAIA
jgi:hypothetical protein